MGCGRDCGGQEDCEDSEQSKNNDLRRVYTKLIESHLAIITTSYQHLPAQTLSTTYIFANLRSSDGTLRSPPHDCPTSPIG